MNKKFIKSLFGFCMSLCLIFSTAACISSKDKRPTIVCTIYPQYDWVIQILGDHADDFNVKYLLNTGVDLHNFEASPGDVLAISSCDLFIYVGGASDEWAENALKNASNRNRKTIALLETVEAKEEEIVEGMEKEDEDGVEYDEHVWLSLRNAQIAVDSIADTICELDGDNAESYRANADNYISALAALDAEYEVAVAHGNKTILFADRFPFRYLADDYGLTYYAAFAGCSAETEASVETVAFLIWKVNELQLNTILVLETSNKELAQTIRRDSVAKNQEILVMHSCQSVKSTDIINGMTYLSIMTDNLDVLRLALG